LEFLLVYWPYTAVKGFLLFILFILQIVKKVEGYYSTNLGDPEIIFNIKEHGTACIYSINKDLHISNKRASEVLKKLEKQGVLMSEKVGTRIDYKLTENGKVIADNLHKIDETPKEFTYKGKEKGIVQDITLRKNKYSIHKTVMTINNNEVPLTNTPHSSGSLCPFQTILLKSDTPGYVYVGPLDPFISLNTEVKGKEEVKITRRTL